MKQDSISSSEELFAMQKMISCRNPSMQEMNQRVVPFSDEELVQLMENHSKRANFWSRSKALGQIAAFSSARKSLKTLSHKVNDRVDLLSKTIQDYCSKKINLVKVKIFLPISIFFKWVDKKIYSYLLLIENRFKLFKVYLIRLFSPVVLPVIDKIILIRDWLKNKVALLSLVLGTFFRKKQKELSYHLSAFRYHLSKLFKRSAKS